VSIKIEQQTSFAVARGRPAAAPCAWWWACVDTLLRRSNIESFCLSRSCRLCFCLGARRRHA